MTIQYQMQRLNGDITGGQTEPIQVFTVIDYGSTLAAESEWQPGSHALIFFFFFFFLSPFIELKELIFEWSFDT